MSKVKVAAAQYDIGFFNQWDDFADKLTQWVKEAAEVNAKLLVFPEYCSMELASLFGEVVYTDLGKQLHAMQDVYPQWQDLHLQLAKQYDVMMLASTFPVMQENGTFRNRANLYAPDGLIDYQDKLIMTRFENEQWLIHPGTDIKVMETDVGKIAVNVCYDSEFPMIAYQQVKAGAVTHLNV